MKMKMNKWLLGLFATSIITFTGCGLVSSSPNPAYTVTNPTTGVVTTNPAVPAVVYTPAPAFDTISNEAAAIAPYVASALGAIPAVAPVAPAIPATVTWALGGISAILASIAAIKNNSANQHAAAAAALASAVVNTPAAQIAVNNSQLNGSTATVQAHLQNANSPV
jgi:hypothetical protein